MTGRQKLNELSPGWVRTDGQVFSIDINMISIKLGARRLPYTTQADYRPIPPGATGTLFEGKNMPRRIAEVTDEPVTHFI